MTTETMNVHQALAELKMLDKRIMGAIQETTWVVANKHSNTKVGGMEVKEYVENVQSRYQKAMDLIRRRDAIKQAVVKSNAATTVDIAGKTYTVAEAIERKNTGVEYLKRFVARIAHDYAQAERLVTVGNGAELERRADEHVRIMIGNSDMKGATAEAQRLRNEFIAAQTTEIVDPIEAMKQIEAMNDEINSFLTNVDAALSVSNALTVITVEY